MKRVFWVAWVLLVTSTILTAKDWTSPKEQEHRQIECQKLAMETSRSAMELEQKASKVEDADTKKLLNELAALKKEESENFSKLSEAIRKKQWTSITRLEKKGAELCEESSEKWRKLDKQKMHSEKTKPIRNEFNKPLPPPVKTYPVWEKAVAPSSPKTSEPTPPVQPTASPEPGLN